MFLPLLEVEASETTRLVLAEADRVRPTRLVFDSLSELRLMADDALRYRRQILALKQHFARQQCTVILVDDRTSDQLDMHLHSLAHGVISMDRVESDYGGLRRVQISKMRGRAFREGYHDSSIRRGGVVVFPRLIASGHVESYPRESVPSGIAALDALLCGGLARGTSTLLLGPSGCGKTSLATQFASHVALQGQRAVMFLFEESIETFREPGQHEHVESPREEAEHLPDRDPPAIAERGADEWPRTASRRPICATVGTLPAILTSEIVDAAIKPPTMPQRRPVTSEAVAISVATRPSTLSRFESENARRALSRLVAKYSMYMSGMSAATSHHRRWSKPCPWWCAIQPPAMSTVANASAPSTHP